MPLISGTPKDQGHPRTRDVKSSAPGHTTKLALELELKPKNDAAAKSAPSRTFT